MSISPDRWRAVVRGTARDPAAIVLRRLLWVARLPYGMGVWWRNRRFDRSRGFTGRSAGHQHRQPDGRRTGGRRASNVACHRSTLRVAV